MSSSNLAFSTRYGTAVLVLLLLAGIGHAWAQSEQPCLDYESAKVRLTGTIVRKTYPGPPEYESVRKGDAPETYWLLVLSKAICMNEDRPNFDPAYKNVQRLQLVFDSEKAYKKYRALLGKHVIATGTLSAGINIHHKTRVLLIVGTLKRAK